MSGKSAYIVILCCALAFSMIVPGSLIISTGTDNNDIVVTQEAPSVSNTIQLKYAQFNPLESLPAIPNELRSQPPIIPGTKMPYIVQANGPITEDWRDELAHNGAEIVSYIPGNAYLVRLSGDLVDRVRSLGNVRWLGDYHPAYKIDPALDKVSKTVDLSVTLFPGATNAYVVKLLKLTSGEVLGIAHNDQVNVVKLRMDLTYIDTLASMPEVKFISKMEPNKPMNDSTTQFVQSGSTTGGRPIFTHGLNGESQIIAIGDSGVRVNHQNFLGTVYGATGTGPKIIANFVPVGSIGVIGDESSVSYHGSHMSGTAVGDGPPYGSYTAATYDGHAYMAQLVMEDICCPDNASTPGIDEGTYIWPPSDMYNNLFKVSEWNWSAKFSSNSWGGGDTYTEDSAQIDRYIWDSQDYSIIFPVGNSGPAASTIESQAQAKNTVSVGILTNAGTGVASISGRGPTEDGRIKPDLMIPGISITSVNGGTTTGYSLLSGTSVASAAAGDAALVRQYYSEGWYPTGTKTAANAMSEPSAALIKATMINGANPLAQIPNMNEGWGSVHLENSLYFSGDTIRTAVVDNVNGLLTDDYVEYQYSVNTGQRLKVTLVYSDYEGDPAASKMLVNDLNLLVTVPGGTQYKGNVFSGGWSATGGSNDTLNNVECVNFAAPVAGVYTIRVTGTAIAMGPQNFALVVSGDLADGYGNVFLDRTVYDDSDTITVSAEDTNNLAASINVTLTTSSGDSETISVPATAPGSGVFRGGTLITALGIVAPGDGTLQVFHGDTVTATYADTSPTHDSHAYAKVDLRGPVITNAYADGILPTAAIIHWDTSENADSLVHYGSTAALGSTTSVTALAINHKVALNGLTPNTLYYYDVESTDWRGRSTRDDNGGEHYIFSTGSPGAGGNLILLVDDDDGTVSPNCGSPFELDWMNNMDSYGWTYTHWDCKVKGIPTLADMNSHTVVVWFVVEGYPQIGAAKRAVIGQYLDQTVTPMGTRPMLFMSGQDIGWDMCDPIGTDRDVAWFQYYTKTQYRGDSANGGGTEPGNFQLLDVGHPLNIYGYNNIDLEVEAYDYPVGNSRFWPDDLTVLTGGTRDWDYSAHAYGGNCAGATQSDGGTGGQARIVYDGFSHDMISSTNNGHNDYRPDLGWIDPERAGILDETIQWLLGGNHPTISLTYPTGGETISGTISITWTVAGANSIDVYYSSNDGQAWVPLATGLPGTATSQSWNTAGLLTGSNYRIKVVASGSALYATLTDYSESGTFTINGIDNMGPKCIAGSVTADELPTIKGNIIWFNATITDDGRGQSNVNAAEYFIDIAGASGTGTAMGPTDGNFNSITEAVTSSFAGSSGLSSGTHMLYVHGRDSQNNWGPFGAATIIILSTTPVASATGPLGGPTNVASITITYTWGNNPTSVNLYYTTNGGVTWTFAGNDATVDGTFDWTCPVSGTYGWIASAVGPGTDEPSPPPPGLGPEAASYILDITPPAAPSGLTVEHYGIGASPASESLTTTGSTQASGPHEVWFCAVDSIGTEDGGQFDVPNVEPTTAEWTDQFYTDGGTSNDIRAGPSGDPGLQDEVFVKCTFVTSAVPATVTQIDLTFEGYWALAATATMYARNMNTNVWDQLGATMAFGAATDGTMSRSITGGFTDYISGGNIIWGVYGDVSSETCSVDFLEVVVSYSTPIGVTDDNTLNWTASGSPDTDHYNIYRDLDGTGGSYVYLDVVPVGTNTYCDVGRGTADGVLWWYRVRAVDAAGNEETNTNGVQEPWVPHPLCSINLAGKPANSWVFVSFPWIVNGPIQTVLNDAISGDGQTIWNVAKWYDVQDKTDPWKTYRVGSSMNDMPNINNTMGIWLWITQNSGDQYLSLGSSGSYPVTAVQIYLYAGWNMVGYPSMTSRPETATLPAQADYVGVWQAASPYISNHTPGASMMSEGTAYWVHVTADCTWVVNP